MRISSAWRSVTVLVLPSAGLAHPAAAVRSRNPVANCRVRYRVCCGDAFRFQNTGTLRSLYRARGERLASVSERRKCVKPGAASVLRHVAAPLGPAALGAGQHMRWSSLKDVI